MAVASAMALSPAPFLVVQGDLESRLPTVPGGARGSALRRLASRNPATGEVIESHAVHEPREIDHKIDSLHRTQRVWRGASFAERAAALRAIGKAIAARGDELMQLITAEMGKPHAEACREIEKSVSACEHYADHAEAYLTGRRGVSCPETVVLHQPLGVVLAIMPWNFPLWQPFRVIAPALMAGNTILLKHAANVSGCARAIESLTRAAVPGIELLHTMLLATSEVPKLIRDDRIRFVAFTGSTRVGRKIGAWAGAALKPVGLELGGNDAYLVLPDADVATAARKLAAARLINNGQTCISPKRIIVHEAVRSAFEAAFVAAFESRSQGDPRAPEIDLGPMARKDLRDRLHRQVQASCVSGAELLTGGAPRRGRGYFYPPTVLTGVRPEMVVAQEEVFGPVGAIIPVRTEEEAFAVANASPFGLGAGIFTSDRLRAERLARDQLEVGMVCINDCVRSHLEIPFGGTKASGFGRELGLEGIRAFTQTKAVTTR